jgi:hypothetical protein
MTTQVAYPHVEKIEGEAARLKRFPRIRVTQLVMDYLAYGWSPDEMCRKHHYLSIVEAHSAMAYYYDHQVEIDDKIEHELTQVDHLSANAVRSR